LRRLEHEEGFGRLTSVLAAGVLEEGTLSYPGLGTPQGGVISPLLANIYLHDVLDVWFEDRVCPRLTGGAFLIGTPMTLSSPLPRKEKPGG